MMQQTNIEEEAPWKHTLQLQQRGEQSHSR